LVISTAAGLACAATTAPTTEASSNSFTPVHIPNDAYKTIGPPDAFLNEVDTNTRRTPDSAPAGHIKSLIPKVPKNGDYTDLHSILAQRLYVSPVNKIRGRRIRVSGWIKTNDVRECAGMMLLAYDANGDSLLVADTTCDRPIHGTTDWQNYQIVADIPQETTKIVLGPRLFCTGEIWADDFTVEVVGNDVPVTEADDWQIFSPMAERYTAAVDPAIQHDGNPAICLQAKSIPQHGWTMYEHTELHPDPKYLGHRIRLTLWMKSSGLTGACGPRLLAFGAWDHLFGDEGQKGHRPLIGTHDWQQYSCEMNIPAETKSIYWGVTMNGRGKLWIDTNSAQIDVIEDQPNPTDGPGN
jgi:hypothetical protein